MYIYMYKHAHSNTYAHMQIDGIDVGVYTPNRTFEIIVLNITWLLI